MACFGKLFEAQGKVYKRGMRKYFEEALSDYVALQLSYDALKWYKKKYKAEQSESLDNLTMDQIFFIGLAYTRCSATTYFDWKEVGDHPPSFHRTNRGFANFPPFASVWKCRKPDAMVNEAPCHFL